MAAFSKLAQDGTTLILPSDVNNPASMIAQVRLYLEKVWSGPVVERGASCLRFNNHSFQAMAVYEKVHVTNSSNSPPPAPPAGKSTSPPSPPRTTSTTPAATNVELLGHSPTAHMFLENQVKLPKQFHRES